jgi:hypothetical protein
VGFRLDSRNEGGCRGDDGNEGGCRGDDGNGGGGVVEEMMKLRGL